MKARVHIFVSGRVQGVFFRSETCREARRYKLKGWVKNLSDGRVEAVFEGEKKDVERLIEFCRNGSPNAQVSAIKVQWEEYALKVTAVPTAAWKNNCAPPM